MMYLYFHEKLALPQRPCIRKESFHRSIVGIREVFYQSHPWVPTMVLYFEKEDKEGIGAYV